jgi:hypothetical protein
LWVAPLESSNSGRKAKTPGARYGNRQLENSWTSAQLDYSVLDGFHRIHRRSFYPVACHGEAHRAIGGKPVTFYSYSEEYFT